MNIQSTRSVAVVLLLLGSGVVSATAAKRGREPSSEHMGVPAQVPVSRDTTMPAPDSLTGHIVARNPFRPERKPSPIRYEPGAPAAVVDVPAPAPERPAFVLRGIVEGREPRAVIEGFPGTNQPIAVRVGEQRGRFRIEAIAATRVVITGADTTWTLQLKVPW